MNDNYGIMEAIQQLQNAKTATEIQQAAEFFILITEENKQLKEQLRKLKLSDMSKEQSSINYYNLYKELTTAEKLLWLVENCSEFHNNESEMEVILLWCEEDGGYPTQTFDNCSTEENINAAYEWAKQRTVDTNKQV